VKDILKDQVVTLSNPSTSTLPVKKWDDRDRWKKNLKKRKKEKGLLL